MEQRTMGNTDLTCSPIGFGTWEMSMTDYGDIDPDEVTRAIHAAIDHGITLIDTARVLRALQLGRAPCQSTRGQAQRHYLGQQGRLRFRP